jgi:signal transduction histidine kinase
MRLAVAITTRGRKLILPLVGNHRRLQSQGHRIGAAIFGLQSKDEDHRRRELILMALLLGVIGFTTIAFLSLLANVIYLGSHYHGASPWALIGVIVLFSGLYGLRIWHPRLAAIIFVALFGLCGLVPLALWGIILPQGLLTCALCIIMAGIVISSLGAFITMTTISISILVITRLQLSGVVHPDYVWLEHGVNYADATTFGATFAIMVLISWLYNREIQKSLLRARVSEAALLKERDLLEIKVVERTKALELIQYEKTLELQRFAEFGRLTSGLIHDLANPLTAVSLNLEQINGPKSDEVEQAKMGVRFLEQYISSAREQLQSSGKLTYFQASTATEEVVSILGYKARQAKVVIEIQGSVQVELHGDKAKFNQIMANLLANAMDAYEDMKGQRNRKVKVIIKESKPGEKLSIQVWDWGVGIGPTVLKRLFEPFYSTKKDGRGIGVGLLLTKQFVERDFGGHITARSSRKEGTVFEVVIPVKAHGPTRTASSSH